MCILCVISQTESNKHSFPVARLIRSYKLTVCQNPGRTKSRSTQPGTGIKWKLIARRHPFVTIMSLVIRCVVDCYLYQYASSWGDKTERRNLWCEKKATLVSRNCSARFNESYKNNQNADFYKTKYYRKGLVRIDFMRVILFAVLGNVCFVVVSLVIHLMW